MDEDQKTTNEQVEPEVISVDGKQNKKKLWAVVAYFIFFLPLLTDHKDNPYVKFHVKQGLVLFILFVVQAVIAMVPVIGWIATPILFIVGIVLLILGVINAVTGKQKELPLIGKLSEHFNF